MRMVSRGKYREGWESFLERNEEDTWASGWMRMVFGKDTEKDQKIFGKEGGRHMGWWMIEASFWKKYKGWLGEHNADDEGNSQR